jgi:hypothetical protein
LLVVWEQRHTDSRALIHALLLMQGAEGFHVASDPQGDKCGAVRKVFNGTTVWVAKCTAAILEFLAATDVGI